MKRCVKAWIPAMLAVGLTACETLPERAPEPAPEDMRPAEPLGEVERDVTPEQTVEERYAVALGYMRSGRNDAAQRELEALMRDAPDASGPPTNLGILAVREGRHRQAQALLEEALLRNPDNLVARNWLGHSHRQNRRPESAERAWLAAVERDPDYTAAHINLGQLYEDVLADLPAAVRHYRAAYESDPEGALRVLPWIARLEDRLQADAQRADARTAGRAQNQSTAHAGAEAE